MSGTAGTAICLLRCDLRAHDNQVGTAGGSCRDSPAVGQDGEGFSLHPACPALRFQVLHWAQHNADFVVPLYCFDPRHYLGTHCYGWPKTGPHRLRFLLESVKDLRETLKKKGR